MKPSTTSLMLATATAMRALDAGMPLFKPLTEKPRVVTKKRSRSEDASVPSVPSTPTSVPSTPTGSVASLDEDEFCRKKKCVRWSTVTVYEFGVTIGGSAVPRRGGPAIGLAKKPKTIWSATVDAVEYQSSSSDDSDTTEVGGETNKENVDAVSNRAVRRRRVRWFKPLERVQLLTEAGCSEKRIYRTMMESSEIAMSRRLSISMPRKVVA